VIHALGGAELRGPASRRGLRARKLANGLGLSTTVLSPDLSGVRVTVHG
jgi:hypothetical protein